MANIAKVQLNDTIDFQRRRINEIIDVTNTTGEGVREIEGETDLPTPSAASSNVYVIKYHTKYKGAVLASLVNGTYKMVPLKNDVINSNLYVYIDKGQLGTGVSLNKFVYLDASGIWQLANCNDPTKYAQGIVGPYNSIILGGIVYSTGMGLTTGKTYYYDELGSLTDSPTKGKIGVALNSNTLSLHLLTIDEGTQPDWNQNDSNKPDYIKNKPSIVSKESNGLVPQLPNEDTVTKFLRQDGTWSELNALKVTGDKMIGTLPNVGEAQVRNIVILDEESDTGEDGTLYGVIEDY